MPSYQLYHYSAGRRFERTDRYDAGDDSTALDKAREKAFGHDMELWCGRRRVQVFDLIESDETLDG